MDTELQNTNEDAELTDCDGEKVVTMMDVLQEQQDFEEDANAVLGASDDKNCTYSKGYIKRQAIYACMTCCSDAKDDPSKRAGVCLACSLVCHENHDLIELYTKRNFKCDCGNPKFNSHPCQFTPSKIDFNEENNYNHNFSGFYCICQRPYPDPESTVDVEMIQCIICEDWLHASHLEATVPDNDQYSEMICKGCMEKNDFLHDYSNLAVNVDVDVVTNGIDNYSNLCNGDTNPQIVKSETVNDVEMADTNSSDDITNNERSTEITSNGDSMSDPNENQDGEKSVETQMETNGADSNHTELDINQEQHNETKELSSNTEQTENAEVAENIEKNAEQLEEEKLLADPDDKKNLNPEANSENKLPSTGDENATIADTEKTINENQTELNKENHTKVDEELHKEVNEEKQKEINEKQQSELYNEVNEEEQSELNKEQHDEEQQSELNKQHNEVNEEQKSELNSEQYDGEQQSELNNKQHNEINEEQQNEVNEEQQSEVNEEQPIKVSEEKYDETNKENNRSGENLSNEETTAMESENTATNNEIHNEKTEVKNNEKITEKRKLSSDDFTDTKKAKLGETNEPCGRPKGVHKSFRGATFWPSTFRQKLCTCRECITMYKDLSVLFLIDPEDTVTEYENLGKLKINGEPATQYEKGLQALSSLDRIQQINALTEYNKMRDKLLDFLKSFKDRRQVVTEDDIREFFAGMKPKREPDGVYFCR